MTKLSLLFVIILSFLVVSCNDNNDKGPIPLNDTVSNVQEADSIDDLSGCYQMVQQKDTAILNLDVRQNVVSGNLEYRRFEKDQNKGIVSGMLGDSLLVANYTFQSEGTSSVREVVFLIKGDSLFEGYGETRVKGDSARFVNTSKLKFMTQPFVKRPCEGL